MFQIYLAHRFWRPPDSLLIVLANNVANRRASHLQPILDTSGILFGSPGVPLWCFCSYLEVLFHTLPTIGHPPRRTVCQCHHWQYGRWRGRSDGRRSDRKHRCPRDRPTAATIEAGQVATLKHLDALRLLSNRTRLAVLVRPHRTAMGTEPMQMQQAAHTSTTKSACSTPSSKYSN